MHELHGGVRVFAGQRAEGFYVDLGAIFDLGDLRPFENLHAQYGMHIFSKGAAGVNATAHLNVHSIAIQVPTGDLLSGHPARQGDRPGLGHRRVDHGQPPAGQGLGLGSERETSAPARSARSPAWPTRWSTRS